MRRRPLLAIAGWLGAAALAVGAGLAATDVIGNGLSPSQGPVQSEDDVARALAEAAVSPPPPAPAFAAPPAASPALPPPAPASPVLPSPAPAASGGAHPVRKTFRTAGGTIIAQCVAARVQVLSLSPAQGYAVHDGIGREPQSSVEVEFRGRGDNDDRVKADLRCSAGEPVLQPHD